MILIGDHTIIDNINETGIELKVFNLSSLKEGYERTNILPYNNVNYDDEKKFDLEYSQYILNNDHIFIEFFKLIKELYEGNHIFILIGKDEHLEHITESLTKFIQQRYGYISNYINDIDDLYLIEDKSDFSLQGLYNLDIDKERYFELTYKG